MIVLNSSRDTKMSASLINRIFNKHRINGFNRVQPNNNFNNLNNIKSSRNIRRFYDIKRL